MDKHINDTWPNKKHKATEPKHSKAPHRMEISLYFLCLFVSTWLDMA